MTNVNSMIDIATFLAQRGLSLERLGTLCRFVDAGGLSPAAGHDHARVSQYSRQIKDLEAFFGVPLLRRVGRAGVPTDTARRLATLVRAHVGALSDFAAAERRAPQRVTLASSHSVLEWWVMPRMDAMRAALPSGSSIVLLDLRTREIAEAVETRQADLGLLRADAVPAGLMRTQVARYGYALFVEAALVRGRSARDLLRGLPLAVSMGGQFREQLEDAAARARAPLNVALECSSFTLASTAVFSGYGAVLPEIAVAAFRGGRVACLALPFKPDPARSLVAAWPRGDQRPWLAALRSALR